MGLQDFFTFVDKNLFSTTYHSRSVNLQDKNVIIDGFSLLYFLYEKMLEDDKKKPAAARVTRTKFGYDGCSRKFLNTLRQFKDRCASVQVVFDGIFKRNARLKSRSQPTKSVRFNGKTIPLPSLIYEEFMNILHHLQIRGHIAEGEADPLIVHMARVQDAYIVGNDSDYHLYQFPRGYVPLSYLSLNTLKGRLYHMTDIFHGMDEGSVALWATTMAFDFIRDDRLEEFLSTKTYKKEKEFHRQLNSFKWKEEKNQRLILQWKLCRYIQQTDKKEALRELNDLILFDDRSSFKQAMQNFVDASNITSIQTRNKNALPPRLFNLYKKGELDRAIIDILTTGKVLHLWKGANLAHRRLLLPMCRVLLQWDCEETIEKFCYFYVTFNQQKYNPFKLVEFDNPLLLKHIAEFSEKEKRRFVQSCVDFALQPQLAIKWRGINRDKRLYLSLLRLWFHTTKTTGPIQKSILLAMIVSFLKHTLLDTYDEKQERITKSEQLPEKLLRYSERRLKKYISLSECSKIRTSIKNYPISHLSNENVYEALEETEQFYKELIMVNQFFYQPFAMLPPHKCISSLTYQVAVTFAKLQNPSAMIPTLVNQNKLLIQLTEEIQTFVTQFF